MSRAGHVSAFESAFLAMERPGLPMHVAGLLTLDGDPPVSIADVHELVASRMRRLPRFRQRVEGGDWVKARVDLRRHLFHHHLPAPGGSPQLHALCGEIQEQVLPRDRPLWELHLIDGLHGRGQAVLVKTHHAITDGMAGVEVAETLFDRSPEQHHGGAAPLLTFAGHAVGTALAPLQVLLGIAATAAGGPLALEGPFNGPVGPRRAFATADLPLQSIREAKHQYGGTVDDVVVAMVAAGLRAYLRDSGYPNPPRALRAMLPVSTCAGRPGGLGNHVSAVFVDLPMDLDDMGSLVRAVGESKSLLRSAHAAAGVEVLVRATGLLPDPLHALVMRVVSEMRGYNLVLSDIPAPDEPLFLLGRRITGSYPIMPLGGSGGLSIAVLGMAGKLCVGITTDPDLVPSGRRIAHAIESVVHRQRAAA